MKTQNKSKTKNKVIKMCRRGRGCSHQTDELMQTNMNVKMRRAA
jgi:hypothetical protein